MSGGGGIVETAKGGMKQALRDPLTLINPMTALQSSALTGQSPTDLLMGPKPPKPSDPVTPPTEGDAQAAARSVMNLRRAARGRSSTILTEPGTLSSGQIKKKSLLGY